MKRYWVIYVCVFALSWNGYSQISPPGLGNAKTASWFAIGVRQELDTIAGKGWQSMSYLGIGRKSTPDSYNLFQKQAIWVVNQEFYHQFHHNWQYSMALSYRKQDEYLKEAPYYHDNPQWKQEFRLYGRMSYLLSAKRIKFIPTFRQEFRKYYTPDFHNLEENFQLRSRLRLQLKINLDAQKIHRLIVSSEQLFSISKKSFEKQWTGFNYNESRFSLYYSYSPKTIPLIFNVGYMNNLLGAKKAHSVHYLAFDIIIENPFKLQKRSKENIYENLE